LNYLTTFFSSLKSLKLFRQLLLSPISYYTIKLIIINSNLRISYRLRGFMGIIVKCYLNWCNSCHLERPISFGIKFSARVSIMFGSRNSIAWRTMQSSYILNLTMHSLIIRYLCNIMSLLIVSDANEFIIIYRYNILMKCGAQRQT